jgi:uncharacterized protein with ATP-grasp and redox domains
LLKTDLIPENMQETILRRLLRFFSEVDYKQSPPALGQELHRMLREVLQDQDPYRQIKEKYNRLMLDQYQKFMNIVMKSPDPFDTAMRLAIAGNVIDFGSHHRLDVMETIDRVMDAKLAVDDSSALRDDLKSAESVLYIGDNAGEIVLDKIFIEIIDHRNIYFAVRGYPAINDATTVDATAVGIDRHAKIITTGDDAPGVVWETSSDEFKRIFEKADVIISKGQGNFEGLADISQNTYFLLVTKCKLVSDHIGVNEKDFVVLGKNHSVEKLNENLSKNREAAS